MNRLVYFHTIEGHTWGVDIEDIQDYGVIIKDDGTSHSYIYADREYAVRESVEEIKKILED